MSTRLQLSKPVTSLLFPPLKGETQRNVKTENVLEQELLPVLQLCSLHPCTPSFQCFSIPDTVQKIPYWGRGSETSAEKPGCKRSRRRELIGNAAGWLGALAKWGLMLVLIDVEELSSNGVDARPEKCEVCMAFEQK